MATTLVHRGVALGAAPRRVHRVAATRGKSAATRRAAIVLRAGGARARRLRRRHSFRLVFSRSAPNDDDAYLAAARPRRPLTDPRPTHPHPAEEPPASASSSDEPAPTPTPAPPVKSDPFGFGTSTGEPDRIEPGFDTAEGGKVGPVGTFFISVLLIVLFGASFFFTSVPRNAIEGFVDLSDDPNAPTNVFK